ncbi:MAG TPA: hypothetical protein VH000_03265 [Rhizomicrobium sp.]|jgi:hypothetical protein|nr:hypothetical protein [Rhizomicrobium sp.]HEX4533226.1 hypothetical protein [Rhizomicrobium sp.]
MSEPQPPVNTDPHARWKFLRDVFVFQLKLVLGNLQNFLLLPVSLGAAVLDLFGGTDREGGHFYRVLDWGRKTDEAINIYSAIGGYHSTGGDDESALKSKYNVDAVLAKIEGAIVREYEKGGTAASVKGAVDRALDGMQEKAGPATEKMKDKVKDAAEKMKEATDHFTEGWKKD